MLQILGKRNSDGLWLLLDEIEMPADSFKGYSFLSARLIEDASPGTTSSRNVAVAAAGADQPHNPSHQNNDPSAL
jgi:hypothetical protein